jgi:uncharacterized protein with HEPN domain
MPQRDPGVYLEDIEHYAAAAVRFTSGFSLEQYLADEKTRAAVERVLEVCGEAMSNLYRVAPAVAETIPHARDIIGFRDILAHGYAELDHNKVYNIAIAHAPQLLLAVQAALKAFPDPPPFRSGVLGTLVRALGRGVCVGSVYCSAYSSL